MRFGKAGLLIPALVLGLVAGCGGGGSGSFSFLPDPKVHFVNASPDSVSLDFQIDATFEANQVVFGSLAPVVSISPGDHDAAVYEDGTSVSLDGVANTFKSNTDTIVAAVGLENYGTENLKRLRQMIFTADIKAPNGSKSTLIIVHAFCRAAGFETPNVDFTPPGTNPLNPVQNIAFATSKVTTIDSGVQEFVVVRTGTTPTTPYVDSTFDFQPGKVYLAMITGQEGGTGNLLPQVLYIPLN